MSTDSDPILGGDELLTARDLAATFRIDQETVYTWRKRGSGPKAFKVGAGLRWRLSEVKRWLAEQERTAS